MVDVFATAAATEQFAALVDAAPRWTVVEDKALDSLSDSVSPAGVVGLCRHLDRPLAHVLDRAPRLVALCADVRDPGNAGTVIRCADAAGAGRGGARRALRGRLQPQDRAGLGRQRLPPPAGGGGGRRGRGPGRARRRGCRSWPPTVPGSSASTTPTSCWPGPPPGCSATRRGACPRSSPRWPTTGCGSRSTAAPRASTCPRPRRCASTPPRGPNGRTGVPEQRSVPDPAREALDALPDGAVVADGDGHRHDGQPRPPAGSCGCTPRRPWAARCPRCWPCRTRRAATGAPRTGRTRGWSPAPPSPSSPGCSPTAPRCSSPRGSAVRPSTGRSTWSRSACARGAAGPAWTGSAPTWSRPSRTSSARR